MRSVRESLRPNTRKEGCRTFSRALLWAGSRSAKQKHRLGAGVLVSSHDTRIPACVRPAKSDFEESFLFTGCRRTPSHPDSNNCLVIESFDPGRVLSHSLEDGFDHARGRLLRTLGYHLFRSPSAEEFSFAVARVENAIAEEYEHVAGFHAELELIVLCFIEETERQASRLDDLVLASMYKNGAGKARVGHRQGSLRVVPDGIDDGNKLRFDAAFGEREIDSGKHLSRRRLDGSMGTDDPADEGSINRSGRSFPAHVADDNAQTRNGIREEIVETPANGPCRDKLRGHVEMRELGIGLGQQPAL